MKRDYFYPSLADRDDPRTWTLNCAEDAWTRARTRARSILATHHPQYLMPEQEQKIWAEFKILI